MEKKKQSNGIKRRKFLQMGSTFAASAMFLPVFGNEVFDTLNPSLSKSSIPAITLNNGLPMPMLGFGTNTLKGPTCVRCVSDAISVGYRLIDTAKVYGNEEAVGEGIKQSGFKREDLFITSKLWVDDSGYESSKKAFETSKTNWV